jgi:hypothetical protein
MTRATKLVAAVATSAAAAGLAPAGAQAAIQAGTYIGRLTITAPPQRPGTRGPFARMDVLRVGRTFRLSWIFPARATCADGRVLSRGFTFQRLLISSAGRFSGTVRKGTAAATISGSVASSRLTGNWSVRLTAGSLTCTARGTVSATKR